MMSENTPKSNQASTNKTTTKKKVRRKPKHSRLLVISSIVAMIPIAFVLYLLLDSYMNIGKPIFGDRYLNDLNPPITEQLMVNIVTKMKTIDNVEDCTVKLQSATLKVYVDGKSDIDVKKLPALTKSLSDALYEVVPADPYFTAKNAKKMYDYEIHFYDIIESAERDYYYVINKSSNTTEIVTHDFNKPRNPELVEQINKEKAEEAESEKKEGQ